MAKTEEDINVMIHWQYQHVEQLTRRVKKQTPFCYITNN